MSNKKATLVGYHGHKNLGDDIFLRVLIHWIGKSLGVGECFVIGNGPAIPGILDGVKLHAVENPIKGIARVLWLPIFYRSIKSDYLVFAAGSIFTIQPFFIMYVVLSLLKIIRRDKLKIAAIGISVGPFKSDFDRYWCFKSLGLMDSILLRDEASKRLLDEAAVGTSHGLSYDMALCWGNIFLNKQEDCAENKTVIGVALTRRGFGECRGGEHSLVCEAITSAIREFAERCPGSEIRILNVCGDVADGDRGICEHIRDRLIGSDCCPEIVDYDGRNIELFVEKMSECTLMVASRMHAGIVALGLGVPVFQISYAEKITNFYKHCQLQDVYLRDASMIKKEELLEFILKGVSGDLSAISEERRGKLRGIGAIVSSDLQGAGSELNS